jgi:glycosyltransferase involved in cell wall biosynthesis
MSERPRASVVTSAYNDLRFLDAAVDSVLQQDFRDFEFIIVDDGTGETAIFDSLRGRDPRIRVLVNPANLGAATAANRGIEEAQSDIIVRLDADDVCAPTRLGKLVAAFEQDARLGLVGSAAEFIDEAGHVVGAQAMPETDLEIRWTILFHNPFWHSTVAFRRSCFEAAGRYRPEEAVSYDHYLWFDMLPFCRARNLPKPLTQYRLNSRGLAANNAIKPRNRTHRIREVLWSRLGLVYDLYDDDIARDVSIFINGKSIAAAERRFAAYSVMLKVLRAFLGSEPVKAEPATARQLKQRMVTRMLADLPADREERSNLYRLCWRLDPWTTGGRWMKRLRAINIKN